MYRSPQKDNPQLETAYTDAKKNLRASIRRRQKQNCRNVLRELDTDVWGLGYKIVGRKITRNKIPGLTTNRIKEIIDTLFPTHDVGPYNKEDRELERRASQKRTVYG